MVRVVALLLLTGIGFGLVAYLGMHRDLWEPQFNAYGLERDGRAGRMVLKAFVVIVVGVPLSALIYAVVGLGADKGKKDIHGYTVIRPKAGMRFFAVVASVGLAALFFAYPVVDPDAAFPWAFQLASAGILLAGFVILTGKIRYDQSTVATFNPLTGWRQHEWSQLSEVKDRPEHKDYLLRFRTGRKMSISYRYAGLEDFLETARAKQGGHAGIARGRNRQMWS